jgi:hypothetical protein
MQSVQSARVFLHDDRVRGRHERRRQLLGPCRVPGDVPFAHVHGPESVDAGAAVAWARARADKVIVRVGGDRFSAGKQPAGDLPDWVGPTAPATKATAPSEPTAWRVEAHINWLRPDTEDVAARFAAALGDQPGASGVGYDIRDFGLAVWFLIRALNWTPTRLPRTSCARLGPRPGSRLCRGPTSTSPRCRYEAPSSQGATRFSLFTGTAKAMPSPRPCAITPITLPFSSSSGPPELPGLIAASV